MPNHSSENQDPELLSTSSKAALPSEPFISHDPDAEAEGEVMTSAHFTRGLPEIVLGYVGDDVNTNWLGDSDSADDETKPFSIEERKKFMLFGAKSEYFISKQAATLILRGEKEDIEKALALVKQNPHIVHCVTRAFDPLQRSVKGTLIQIAAMAGDVGLKPGIVKGEEQGAVESLIAVAGLSRDEVAEQLKVLTSEEAIRENEARNQQILKAIKRFGEGIIALESKGDDSLEQFQAKCQPLIDQLEKDLRPDANRVLISGYIFDPMILKETLDWYDTNFNRFSDWSQRDVFIINGYGKLQAQLSSRDAQVVRDGIGPAVDRGKIPPRTLNNADGSSYFYNPQSRLGIDFFVGYYGGGAGRAGGDVRRRPGGRRVGKLMSNKNSSLARLMRPQAQAKQNRCSIM
ncbi:MAG TPA: hypothetical protein VLH77_06640 [Gammaproteobacteria bacterium]|nr:hypothetical protein [Gammaproteobacteria bacterium]